MQGKHPKKSTRRGHKRSTGRGHQKGPNEAPGEVPKNTFGRQPVHGKVGQFRPCPLSPCALCKKKHKRSTRRDQRFCQNGAPASQRAQMKHQKVQLETTKGAPERPEVLPKRSASKSNQRAQMKHQKVNQRPQQEHQRDQRFCQERSTSKSNQRAQMKHQKVQSETTNGAPERPEVLPRTEHQQVQSESTNEAPESTIRDHKRSTRETRGFAKTEHQQVQPESTNEAPENTIRDHKWSTRETRSFAKNGAPASPIREQSTIRDHKRSTRGTRGCTKTEHQQIQSEITNKAPESTIRDHKRSTRETRGFAKTEHQQAQSESCNVLEASPTFGQSFWIRKSPSRPLLGSCSYRIVKCDEYLQLPTAMGCILMVKVFTIFLFF